MDETWAIETQKLTKIYGSGHMQVGHGELVALLGPSGSGKSTFLTAVALINPPTSGRVFIDGQLVMDGPRATTDIRKFRRRHIGYVFQKSNLIPFLSAVDNVQIALELDGQPSWVSRRRALELLDYLGVADRARHMPSQLSGGEQQRVAVARALANQPSVILADEPTAALDKRLGRQVMELFRMVAHEQNGGVIVVTHDHRTLDVFDTIYEMEDGLLTHQTSQLAGV
jgi:putative ABC transport system ATP-binding protein